MSSKHDERMRRFLEAGLYLVTSQSMSGGRTTLEIVRAALDGGVRLIQLREKDLCAREIVRLGTEVRKLTEKAGALLIINDRLDLAMAVGADGVHLGQDDLSVADAREIAPDLIIGASTHSVAEAIEAEKHGASYVNIGPIFPTRTKKWDKPFDYASASADATLRSGSLRSTRATAGKQDREFLGLYGVRHISKAISIPFTVMGGIKKQHIPELLSAGVRTIAVVTAVIAADDPERAARELLDLMAG